MKHSRASGPLVTVVSRTLNQEAYIIVRRNYYRRRFKPVYYWSEGLTYEGRAHWGLAYRFEAEVNKVVTLCLSIIQRFLFFIQRISDSSHFWCKVDDFTCISRRNNGLRLVLPEAIQNARTKDELRAISQISAGETNCHKTVNKITVCEKNSWYLITLRPFVYRICIVGLFMITWQNTISYWTCVRVICFWQLYDQKKFFRICNFFCSSIFVFGYL